MSDKQLNESEIIKNLISKKKSVEEAAKREMPKPRAGRKGEDLGYYLGAAIEHLKPQTNTQVKELIKKLDKIDDEKITEKLELAVKKAVESLYTAQEVIMDAYYAYRDAIK